MELVRDTYFRGSILQGMRAEASTPTGATHSSPITGEDSIQADLYFPSMTGFGDWRILCSHAFLSEITLDNAMSKGVLGRLQYVPVTSWSGESRKVTSLFYRELSLGCFSHTNQRRLTRDSPIDIFRARLPGGTRLVVSALKNFPLLAILMLYKYLIDVAPEFGRDVSRYYL